jgi:hypothetical protein
MTENDKLVLQMIVRERGIADVLRVIADLSAEGEERATSLVAAIDGTEGSATKADMERITALIRRLRELGEPDDAIQNLMEKVAGVRERPRLTYGRAPKVVMAFRQRVAQLEQKKIAFAAVNKSDVTC